MNKIEIKKCVGEIIDALYDRGGFDDWWSNIDNETEKEIIALLENIVEKRFNKILEQVEQEWKQIEDANLCEPLKSWDEHSYLQGFIDQFGTGEFGELDSEEWNALGFLAWLKLNNYEIIKKKK